MNRDIHKWIVLVATFSLKTLNYGLMLTFGVIFNAIMDTFKEMRSTTAIVQSLYIAFSMGFGIITGILASKFDLRAVAVAGAILSPVGIIMSHWATSVLYMDITVGVISGIGNSFIVVAGVLAIGRSFTGTLKTVALSIQSLETPIAGFCYPHLVTFLLDTYSLKGTLLILGGTLLNALPCAIVFWHVVDVNTVPVNSEKTPDIKLRNSDKSIDVEQDIKVEVKMGMKINLSKEKELQDTNKSKHQEEKRYNLLSTVFILNVIGSSLVMSCLSAFITLYQDVLKAKDLTIFQSNIAYNCFSAFNLIARLLPILPGRIPKINIFVVPVISSLSGCLGSIVLLLDTSYPVSLIGVSLTGLCEGAIVSSLSVIVYRIVKQGKQELGFGIVYSVSGILISAAGPIFGSIRDSTESYDLFLIMCCVIYSFTGFLFIWCILKTDRVRLCRLCSFYSKAKYHM